MYVPGRTTYGVGVAHGADPPDGERNEASLSASPGRGLSTSRATIDGPGGAEDVDLAALARRIELRLDEILDLRSIDERRNAAELERDRAVRAWSSALSRGARAGDIALRRAALATTVLRIRGNRHGGANRGLGGATDRSG